MQSQVGVSKQHAMCRYDIQRITPVARRGVYRRPQPQDWPDPPFVQRQICNTFPSGSKSFPAFVVPLNAFAATTYILPKNQHLQLRRDTEIPYNEMLFFDDSKWSVDHCAEVAKNCPGVVTVRTPTVSHAITCFALIRCRLFISAHDSSSSSENGYMF